MTIEANVLWIFWLSAAVALVFWVMHYVVANLLANTTSLQSLGTAISTFFP